MKVAALRALLADLPDDRNVFFDAVERDPELYADVVGTRTETAPIGSPTGPISTVLVIEVA